MAFGAEVIGGEDERFSRVVFNEITKNAITQAFSHPEQLNMDRTTHNKLAVFWIA